MTREEAKEALHGHRAESLDRNDPTIREALALVATDRELREWFARQEEFHLSVAAQLRQVIPPAGLKEQLLAQRNITRVVFSRRALGIAAAAAGIALLIGVITQREPTEQQTVASFQARMVSFALRQYRMDLETSEYAAVRAHLSRVGAPADLSIPQPLTQVGVKGGAGLKWHGKPVAMVCFNGAGTSTRYLFAVQDRGLAAKLGENAIVEPYKGVSIARWATGGTVYLLVSTEDQSALRRLLSATRSTRLRVAFADAGAFEQPIIISRLAS